MRFKDVIRFLVGINKGLSAVRSVVVNKCDKRQKRVICWFPHTATHLSSSKQMPDHDYSLTIGINQVVCTCILLPKSNL